VLYLAYGSNLSRARMAARCPAAQPVRPVTVTGWGLRFETVATIVPDPRATLCAALYRLTPACERTLDAVEGVDEGRYRRATLQVPGPGGEVGSEPVLTYIKIDARRGPPTQDYLAHIAAGFADWGLDGAPLRDALVRVGAMAEVAAIQQSSP